jgi:hypothetical protein
VCLCKMAFSLQFFSKNFVFFSILQTFCSQAYRINLNLTTLVIFDVSCRLWSFSLCDVLQSLVTSSVLGSYTRLTAAPYGGKRVSTAITERSWNTAYNAQILVPYFLILGNRRYDNNSELKCSKRSPNLICFKLLICNFDLLYSFHSTSI